MSALLLDAPEISLQCKWCETKTHIKKTKRKQFTESDLSSKKEKQKKALEKTKPKIFILYVML